MFQPQRPAHPGAGWEQHLRYGDNATFVPNLARAAEFIMPGGGPGVVGLVIRELALSIQSAPIGTAGGQPGEAAHVNWNGWTRVAPCLEQPATGEYMQLNVGACGARISSWTPAQLESFTPTLAQTVVQYQWTGEPDAPILGIMRRFTWHRAHYRAMGATGLPFRVPAASPTLRVGLNLRGVARNPDLAKLADALREAQVAPLPLPTTQQSPTTRAAGRRARAALDLRYEEPWFAPAPARAAEFPGVSITIPPYGPTAVTLAQPHKATIPVKGTKEKKLFVRGAIWGGYHLVMNALTETNDFVAAMWDALPRRFKRARVSVTGNRRTDIMLRDLVRGWEHVDWDEAFGNYLANQLEDLLIGKSQRVLNRAGLASGQGFGTTMSKLHEAGGVNPYSGLNSIVQQVQRSGAAVSRDIRGRIPSGIRSEISRAGLQYATAGWRALQPFRAIRRRQVSPPRS